MRSPPIALIVSVLLNLFLVGVLAGGAAWLRAGPRMIAAGSLRIAGAELPAAERRAFRHALSDTRRAMHSTVLDGRAARAQAAALLRRPVSDQVAIRAALARARADDFAVRAAVEERAVAFAATLPPADRARLAEAMEHRASRVPPAAR